MKAVFLEKLDIFKNKIWIPVVLAATTFLIYYKTLVYGFIFDDLPTITRYIHIKVFDPMGQFFSSSRWVSRLLNQFSYRYWQLDPFGYRLIDVLMHIASGVMIFFILTNLFSGLRNNDFLKKYSLWFATIISGLFLLHPAQTQTVTYITQMQLEGLATFFMFLVITAFVYAIKTENVLSQRMLYGASFIFTALAAGTKEVIIVLPVILLLVDWFFIAEGDVTSLKSRWVIHALYFVITIGLLAKFGIAKPTYVSAIVNNAVHNNRGNILTATAADPITFFPTFISQFKVLLHYFWIFVWPFSLSFDYEYKLSRSVFDFDVVIPFLIIAGIIAGMVYLFLRNRTHPINFALAWFFVSMLPRTFFPGTELVCDYKTYFASFGMMILLAWCLMQIVVKVGQRIDWASVALQKPHAQAISVLLLFTVLSYGSNTRNYVWSSELLFWGDVIKKAPTKARGYNNYATALVDKGNIDEAMQNFQKSIECDDWYAEPHINLGSMYQMRGQVEKAMEHYKKALEIGEGHPELFNNLGILHFNNQADQKADHCFRQAIKLRPYYSRAYCNLGKLYQRQNRLEKAITCFENALKGDSPNIETHYLYGVANHELGAFDKAIEVFSRLDKNYEATTFYLGSCYYNKRNYQEAAKYFDACHQKDPENAMFLYNYAMSLLNSGQYAQALPLFEGCKKIGHNFSYAGLHYAKCLYEVGKKNEAKKALQSLLVSSNIEAVKNDARALQKELKLC